MPDVNNEEIVYFPVTVDSSLDFELKSVVLRFCCDSLPSPRIQHIPQKHQMKIWMCIEAGHFDKVMKAIIANLEGAELGPIMKVNEYAKEESAYATRH